jgi:hypothetical protein
VHLHSKLENVVETVNAWLGSMDYEIETKLVSCKHTFHTASSPCAHCHPKRIYHRNQHPWLNSYKLEKEKDSHPMSPHKNSIGIWVPLHSLLQLIRQVLLMGCILNNRNDQFVIVPQTPLLPSTFSNPLNLLQMLNLKASIFAMLPLHEERDKDGPL